MPSPSSNLQSSPAFGNFTLLARLARGDLGELFLARSQGAGGFEKLVIIKRLHSHLMKDADIEAIFMNEARAAAHVEHQNVRMVYEIGRNEEHHYIALEYLEGVPMVDVLLGRKKEKRLEDPRMLAAILAQACEGLHAAHLSQGPGGSPIVHGDINPRSIFVTSTGTTKILDFDIVEMRGALAKRYGFVRRTNAYMSPEEVETGEFGLRSDVFSLGVVAWEAFTGRRLFKQKSRDETLRAIAKGKVPSAQKFRPKLSDQLNATVMRALSRDPSLRFQSARDLGAALERAILAQGPPITPVAIASLLERAFVSDLDRQRSFVRDARSGAISQTTTENLEDTIATSPPPDPDDWREAATRVADLESHIAAARDPFFEAASHADLSLLDEPPLYSDTRNLVLSELLNEFDEGETPTTGEVEIGQSDIEEELPTQEGPISTNEPSKRTGEAPLPSLDALAPLHPAGAMEAGSLDQTNPELMSGLADTNAEFASEDDQDEIQTGIREKKDVEPELSFALPASPVSRPPSLSQRSREVAPSNSDLRLQTIDSVDLMEEEAAQELAASAETTSAQDELFRLPGSLNKKQDKNELTVSPQKRALSSDEKSTEKKTHGSRFVLLGLAACVGVAIVIVAWPKKSPPPSKNKYVRPAALDLPFEKPKQAPSKAGANAAASILAAVQDPKTVDAGLPDASATTGLDSGATSSEQDQMGYLRVRSKAKSIVFVDGDRRGLTPLRIKLSPGPHTIRGILKRSRKTTTVEVEIDAEKTTETQLRY